KRRVSGFVVVAAVVVTALACGVLGGVAGSVVQARRDQPAGSASPSVPADSIGPVVKRILPSVVSVVVPQTDGSEYVGAGSIISRDGYIMTNEHVVSTTKDNGGKVKVELNSGEQVDATVKGMSSTADIAVLKIERGGLPPIRWGDSRGVQVGDRVIAVGNPLGLAETTTSGIVSALNRPVHVNQHSDSYYAAIQTDAAINPGNSGGPLFDFDGRLIGVNYAGAARQNVGLGFAIPERSAQRTAEQLIKTGKATHAVIGVYTDTRYKGDGAKIADSAVGGNQPVASGGPADKAGLQAGDVITKVDGIPVHSSAELTAVIRTQAPGDVVTTVYKRSESPTTTKMTLGEESDQ
ncbi:MAG: trypsin-like peptidase domain-containing protein, partial [Streptosporangiales bacterium]|nr:trypsin-like peptidase domain-containing protein [Streptosporangiales bacterium]